MFPIAVFSIILCHIFSEHGWQSAVFLFEATFHVFEEQYQVFSASFSYDWTRVLEFGFLPLYIPISFIHSFLPSTSCN